MTGFGQSPSTNRPVRLAITLGDVGGVGPEVVVRSLHQLMSDPRWQAGTVQALVIGCPDVVQRTVDSLGLSMTVQALSEPSFGKQAPDTIAVWNPLGRSLAEVPLGQAHPLAGRASHAWLVEAARFALAKEIDAIVTAPLSKLGLHLAGVPFPGHTEILAHECGIDQVAMMLYLPPGEPLLAGHSLSVAHATLHTSIASVPRLLTSQRVMETIELVDHFLTKLGEPRRIGVCALNPHAGEDGLFGDEESRIIGPAVDLVRARGIDASGPFPADTLLKAAIEGRYNGVVAMYHDQGHIALKLIGFHRAVNVTLGLPIIRTSPSQGTAYDIAGRHLADPAGMISAIETAVRLAQAALARSADRGSHA